MNGFDGDIRDMLGCASHVEVCGIVGICGDMRDMRDGPPPRNRAVGLPFFLDRPPNPRRAGKRNGKRQPTKKECLFSI